MSDLMPKEWVLGKASDFVINPKNDIVDGPFGSNLKASEYQFSGTPIIRLQNIKRLRFIEKNIKFVSNEKADTLSRHSYKRGDIVITKLGDPLGLACIVPENFQDGIIVADLVRLRINDLVFDKKYLTYALNSPSIINQLSKHIKGTTRPRINLGIIRDLKIPITSIFEQKLIADKLDTLLAQVDGTKARLEQIPQILKRFRQAVLAMAITGKLTEEWRGNNSILFSEWINSNIGELAQVATGKTPKRTEITYWENGSIPWLTSSSTGRAYVDSAEQFITLAALKECTLKIFPPGTLLLAMYGEGKTRGQVTELNISATCNQACAAIICNKEKIDLQFLKMRLMENYEETRKAAAGGNQPNLNLNKVREIPVLVPPLTEQQEIVRRVEQLFSYADIIEMQVTNALTRVNNLTQSILAKAFRGELTAQWRAENPELISGENSAVALLEKIKAERAATSSKKATRKT